MNINRDLMKAARDFVYPVDKNGRISVVYGDYYFRVDQEKKWGKKAWAEACNKARIEYDRWLALRC